MLPIDSELAGILASVVIIYLQSTLYISVILFVYFVCGILKLLHLTAWPPNDVELNIAIFYFQQCCDNECMAWALVPPLTCVPVHTYVNHHWLRSFFFGALCFRMPSCEKKRESDERSTSRIGDDILLSCFISGVMNNNSCGFCPDLFI